MIFAVGWTGSIGFTAASDSLLEAGTDAAAALATASERGPGAIMASRVLGSLSSAAARSTTASFYNSPGAAPLPFSNIISFIAASPCDPLLTVRTNPLDRPRAMLVGPAVLDRPPSVASTALRPSGISASCGWHGFDQSLAANGDESA